VNLWLDCGSDKIGQGDYIDSNFRRGIKSTIRDNIRQLILDIRELQTAINKPRTHKRKNKERADAIEFMKYRIKDLRRYCADYVDKKPIPVKSLKMSEVYKKVDPNYKNNEDDYLSRWNQEHNDKVDTYKKYFLKDNGKLQINEFQEFIKVKVKHSRYHLSAAPLSIDKIKALLNTKDANTILLFIHADDLNRMIPEIDTPEYDKLKIWLAQRKGHPMNTYLLDKMHTYLLNKTNRKAYTPKPPQEFPVHLNLLRLEADKTKGLTLIKTDKELKTEGRNQSHCIGSKHYIEDCLDGYQALNYKGYTFFLTPDLKIKQTHGRFNSWTPDNIRQELIDLLKGVA
jgi:hypothetical protein